MTRVQEPLWSWQNPEGVPSPRHWQRQSVEFQVPYWQLLT